MTAFLRFAKIKRLVFHLVMAAVIITGGQCKKEGGPGNTRPDEDPLKPAAEVTTTIVGTVVNDNGQPLSGVMVSVGGETTISSPRGTFVLEDVRVPGNRCVIVCESEGYFEGVRAEEPRKDDTTETHIVMMSGSVTHVINAGSGGRATLTNGSSVQLPANGLVDESGAAYTGVVNLAVRYLDPTAPGFATAVPGGDMVAQRTDQSTSMLYSYGILRVKMTDDAGDELQVAPGKTATLTMDIPDKQLATAPATIPLWYFDVEKGFWVEEGSATRQGDKYVGTVKHFTDWNCDVPEESATVIGRLVDCNGDPAWGHIEIGQQSINEGGTSTDTDHRDGRFEQRVPANTPIAITVYDPLYIVPLVGSRGQGKLIVLVPPLSPDQVYDVGTLQVFPCPTTLSGTFKLKSGDQVQYMLFTTETGGAREFSEPPAQFSIGGFGSNATMTLHAATKSGVTFSHTFTTPAGGGNFDLGQLDLTAEKETMLTGRIVCRGAATSGGQISASWQIGSQRKTEYTSPDPNGRFSLTVDPGQSITLSISVGQGRLDTVVQSPATIGSQLELGDINVCQGPAMGVNAFTINGDGFNNAQVTIQAKPYPSSAGFYSVSSDLSSVGVFATDDAYSFSILFPGKSVGAVQTTSGTGILLRARKGNTLVSYYAGFELEGSSASITVTRYDNVGGLIEGTFSGTFKSEANVPVTITNGRFSAVRYPDL